MFFKSLTKARTVGLSKFCAAGFEGSEIRSVLVSFTEEGAKTTYRMDFSENVAYSSLFHGAFFNRPSRIGMLLECQSDELETSEFWDQLMYCYPSSDVEDVWPLDRTDMMTPNSMTKFDRQEARGADETADEYCDEHNMHAAAEVCTLFAKARTLIQRELTQGFHVMKQVDPEGFEKAKRELMKIFNAVVSA